MIGPMMSHAQIICMGQLKHNSRCKILYVLFSERASHIISYCLCPCVMYEHLVLNRCFSIIFRMSVLPRMGCVFVTGRRKPRGGLVAAGGVGAVRSTTFEASGGGGAVAESRLHDATQARQNSRLIASLLPQS